AAEAIAIEYEDLPAVTTLEEAIAPHAPAGWGDRPDNIAFLHQIGGKAPTEKAIPPAEPVIRPRMVITRPPTPPVEPRGCIAEYDPREDRTTVRVTVQGPHSTRRIFAKDIFKLPDTKFA